MTEPSSRADRAKALQRKMKPLGIGYGVLALLVIAWLYLTGRIIEDKDVVLALMVVSIGITLHAAWLQRRITQG